MRIVSTKMAGRIPAKYAEFIDDFCKFFKIRLMVDESTNKIFVIYTKGAPRDALERLGGADAAWLAFYDCFNKHAAAIFGLLIRANIVPLNFVYAVLTSAESILTKFEKIEKVEK